MEFTSLREFLSAVARFDRNSTSSSTVNVLAPAWNVSTSSKSKASVKSEEAATSSPRQFEQRQLFACFNCTKTVHKLFDWPKTKDKCDKCNRHGHISNDCISTKVELVRQVKQRRCPLKIQSRSAARKCWVTLMAEAIVFHRPQRSSRYRGRRFVRAVGDPWIWCCQ